MVDEGFSNLGYGFGLPLGSVHQEELTIKIYNLRESGFTDTLDEKWWDLNNISMFQNQQHNCF